MKDYSNSFVSPNSAIIASGKIMLSNQMEGLDGAIGKIDGVASVFLFRTSTNEYNEQYEQRILVCDSSVNLSRGSIITEVEMNESGKVGDSSWLVISEIDENQISKYAKVQKCNSKITFQLENSDVIYTYPCIYESYISKNSDGTTANKYFEFSNGISKATIPANEVTKSIQNGQRFIFDSSTEDVYELKDVERVASSGLLTLSLRKDKYRDGVDNLDLNVADYKIQDTIESTGYKIVINGSESIIANGTNKDYSATVYYDGEIVVKDVVYRIVETTNLATIISSDLTSATIESNIALLTGVITLRCELEEDSSVYTEEPITIKGYI